jgi:bacillithiol system protein YtxJ
MGILNNIFGNNSSETKKQPRFDWNALTTIEQFNDIVEKSRTKTQAIFKHSTRCGISSGVLKQFEKQSNITIDFHYLDLLNYRDISSDIASRFNVVHQSPQLLVIKNGVVVAHDAHYDIMSIDLERF